MTAAKKDDPNLLQPLVLSGPVVERDRGIKDRNDSEKPKEGVWLDNARAQAAEVSASEVSFFGTLRGRMGAG